MPGIDQGWWHVKFHLTELKTIECNREASARERNFKLQASDLQTTFKLQASDQSVLAISNFKKSEFSRGRVVKSFDSSN